MILDVLLIILIPLPLLLSACVELPCGQTSLSLLSIKFIINYKLLLGVALGFSVRLLTATGLVIPNPVGATPFFIFIKVDSKNRKSYLR